VLDFVLLGDLRLTASLLLPHLQTVRADIVLTWIDLGLTVSCVFARLQVVRA